MGSNNNGVWEYDGNDQVVPLHTWANLGMDTIRTTILALPNLTINATQYTASTTWNKPTGLKALRVRAVGGGGGGGGAPTTAAGQYSAGRSGGGGAYSESLFDADSLPSSVSITIGAAGTGGTSGGAGANGGQTSFGTYVTAPGGNGGIATGPSSGDVQTGVSPSATGTGDIVLPGAASGTVLLGPVANRGWSPPAGDSPFGRGHQGVRTTSGTNGGDGSGYGSGGSGGANSVSQGTARNGGNGTAGLLVIEEYF